jgi:hypothetical protein
VYAMIDIQHCKAMVKWFTYLRCRFLLRSRETSRAALAPRVGVMVCEVRL